MSEFHVSVDITGGVGTLRWEEQQVDVDTLKRAISLAADDAILAHNLRRLQVELPEWDKAARVSLHRAGFRLEGRLRSVLEPQPGVFRDILVYSRLAVDPVYGEVGFSGVLDSILPTKRLIAHALFRDAEGRVLLLETSYKDDWELPGGVVEPGESPRVGGERECLEELGIEVRFGQPLLVDWMPPYLGWSDALELIFDGGVLDDDTISRLGTDDPEIVAIHWVAPEDVEPHVMDLSARRIRLMLDGYTGLTENGYPVPDAG
ncbi:NUDIX hydrolase [Tessaracoccus sp. MC1865]|uniref:NUDIX hydrolase n=1 Tax=Tessaracoccus sp. MC1865 TaxID=2760310 RepID=UPI0016035C71|nr:NUDIX hydrolase [Tessaracoccus sp. MC1865]MBB1483433.1 NUDIX hydrolase [Tessaracoccus sp. MC1865]QTO36535.1 NUDIX hydrolase [Tessaracoccus sp. MC1865]